MAQNSTVASQPCLRLGYITWCMRFASLTQMAFRATSHTPKPLGCVKTHVYTENNPYASFKSNNL